MNALDRIEKFIFESEKWKLILVISLLTVIKTGIWYTPSLSFSLQIAQNPFVNPFTDPNAHFLFWSWLGPFLAWLIGATSKWQFFAFHLLFSLSFTFLFTKLVFSRFSDSVSRSSLVLFSALPVSATAYFWVSTDSITLFLMTLALSFPGSLAFVFIIGILVGMQHFEQGFFAAAGLLFAISLSSRQGYTLKYSWKYALAILLGTISGKFFLYLIFNHFLIDLNSGRLYWLIGHLRSLLSQFFFHSQFIVWSVLGLGWLVALRFTDWGRNSIPFFITLIGLCLLLPVSEDQTRVLAVITFPLIAVYWLLNPDFIEKLTKREISLLFTAWVLVPWGWTWVGAPKWSVFPYDVAYILHKVFGWFSVPADPSLWPFR